MDEVEFDKFAAEYRALHAENIKLSGEEPEYFAEIKVVDIATQCRRLGGNAAAPRAILDFGAGIGYSVPFFVRHLPSAKLTCLDVSRKSLDLGAAKYAHQADFKYFDGSLIPFEAECFDVVMASCVFHHIPSAEHISLLKEIRRVLKRGGMLFVFEHNPLNPLTRHAVNTCAFDEHAELIRAGLMRRQIIDAGYGVTQVRYQVFFPHALRHLRSLEPALAWLPLGAQYCVTAQK